MSIVLFLLVVVCFVAPAAFILGYYLGKRVQANKQRIGFPVQSTSADLTEMRPDRPTAP